MHLPLIKKTATLTGCRFYECKMQRAKGKVKGRFAPIIMK